MSSLPSRIAVLSFGLVGVCVALGGCRYRSGKTWTETRVVYMLAGEPCPTQLPTETQALQVNNINAEVIDNELTSAGDRAAQPDLCWYQLAWGESHASGTYADSFRCPTRSTLAVARSHYARFASEVPRADAPAFGGRGTVKYTPVNSNLIGCVDGMRVLYRPATGGVCSMPDREKLHVFSTEIYHESVLIAQDARPELRACNYRVTHETSSGLEPDGSGLRYGL
jgi:hypothetical protein